MTKGTVLSIDKRTAIVFTDDCQILRLPLTSEMAVGREISVGPALYEPLRFQWNRLARPAWVAALALIVILSVWLIQLPGRNPAYAYLSVDNKSSIQFALDSSLKIVAIQTIDAASAEIIDDLNLTGQPWQQAVENWLNHVQESGDLEGKTVLISAIVPAGDPAFQQQLSLVQGQEGLGAFTRLDVHVAYTSDRKLVDLASENQLTIGRQLLLMQSQRLHQSWDKSTIGTTPLAELVHALLNHEAMDLSGFAETTTQSVSIQEESPLESNPKVPSGPEGLAQADSSQIAQTASDTLQPISPESSGILPSTQITTVPDRSSEPTESFGNQTTAPTATVQESSSTTGSNQESSSTAGSDSSPGPGGPSPSTNGAMKKRMGSNQFRQII